MKEYLEKEGHAKEQMNTDDLEEALDMTLVSDPKGKTTAELVSVHFGKCEENHESKFDKEMYSSHSNLANGISLSLSLVIVLIVPK